MYRHLHYKQACVIVITTSDWLISISGRGWDSSRPWLRWWILEHFCSPYKPLSPSLIFFFTNTFIHKTLNPQCTFYLTYMYVDNVLIYQQSVFKISFQPPKEMNCNQLFPRSYHKPVHRKDSTDKTTKIDMISTAFIHQKKVFTKLYAK